MEQHRRRPIRMTQFISTTRARSACKSAWFQVGVNRQKITVAGKTSSSCLHCSLGADRCQ